MKGPYQTDGDIFENNLIALHLGSAKNVRKYLSRNESLTPVMGRLNGVAVEGVSYPRMMLVTPEMSRYEVFVNFDPMPGEENLYFTHVNGMECWQKARTSGDRASSAALNMLIGIHRSDAVRKCVKKKSLLYLWGLYQKGSF